MPINSNVDGYSEEDEGRITSSLGAANKYFFAAQNVTKECGTHHWQLVAIAFDVVDVFVQKHRGGKTVGSSPHQT